MISNEKKAEVIGLYQSGLTVQQVNKQTGVSVSSIRNILNAAGIYKAKPVGGQTRQVNKEIVQLYNCGFGAQKIAGMMGITYQTVISHLRDAGIYTKDKTGPRVKETSNKDKVINMYKQNKTVVDIATELNISEPTVRKYLKDAGVYKDARVNRRYNNERN